MEKLTEANGIIQGYEYHYGKGLIAKVLVFPLEKCCDYLVYADVPFPLKSEAAERLVDNTLYGKKVKITVELCD